MHYSPSFKQTSLLSFCPEAHAVLSSSRITNLERYGSVKRWITRLNKKSGSHNTRRVYLHYLCEFCKYSHLNPDELIIERKNVLRSRDEYTCRSVEKRLDKWFLELEKKGLARNTCVTCYNAVRSFYRANYVGLLVEVTPSAWPKKIKPGLTREELGCMLNQTTKPLHKAYVLCQSQSGLSISDLLKLTYRNVRSQIEKGSDHIHLRLLRGKEKQLGFFGTFFGKIAAEALREYLSTRKNLKEADSLFPCTARNVNSFLRRLSSKAGPEWTVSSHDLRKYFATNLKLARVNDPAFNETLIEYWQGHSLGKVKGAYFLPPIEEQLRLYKLAEPRLEPVF